MPGYRQMGTTGFQKRVLEALASIQARLDRLEARLEQVDNRSADRTRKLRTAIAASVGSTATPPAGPRAEG